MLIFNSILKFHFQNTNYILFFLNIFFNLEFQFWNKGQFWKFMGAGSSYLPFMSPINFVSNSTETHDNYFLHLMKFEPTP